MIETPLVTVKKLPQGVEVQADARGMQLLFDEKDADEGEDIGPSPVETLLAALGACQTMTAWSLARKMRICLNGLSIQVEGDIDLDGIRGVPGVQKGVSEIRYTMCFDSDAPQKDLERLAGLVEAYCPVGNTLQDGTKLVLAGVKRSDAGKTLPT